MEYSNECVAGVVDDSLSSCSSESDECVIDICSELIGSSARVNIGDGVERRWTCWIFDLIVSNENDGGGCERRWLELVYDESDDKCLWYRLAISNVL